MTKTKTNNHNTNQHTTGVVSDVEQDRPQVTVDDSKANVCYSSNCLITATAEEITVDFARTMRSASQGDIPVITVDTKVIMSPWSAKRLAIQLGQVVQHFEDRYGSLETDANRRRNQNTSRDDVAKND